VSQVIKIVYDNIKINVRERYNKWYLDFTFNKKRIKKTTSLIANDDNLKKLRNDIIPELIVALTGNKKIEYFKKDIKLIDFANSFFKVYKNTVREHVYINNQQIYTNQISSYFKKETIITDIKTLHLEDWQNKLIKKYTHHTVKRYRSIFNSVLQKAFENDVIKVNPFVKVKHPLSNKNFRKLDDTELGISPFNKDEIFLILNNCKGNLYYFIYIMISTGMRPGEIICLTWNDVDFKKKRIAVDKTLVNGKVSDVKTSNSVRYVDMILVLENKLLKFYNEIDSDTNLFISLYKKPYFSHIVMARRFKVLLSKLNIEHRNLYNLRHTFASNMILEGFNIIWVSRMLGHKDISITQEVYIKFINQDNKNRLEYLSKIVPDFLP